MEVFISQLIVSIQAVLPVYLLYRLVYNRESMYFVWFYLFLIILFLLLKYQILYFDPFSLLDYVSWGMYNIGLYVFFITFAERRVWNK